MVYEDESDTMKRFFSGKIGIDNISTTPPKKVELGFGKGIGHKDGSYHQYTKILEKQFTKGNGIISLGKSVIDNEDKDIAALSDPTDKFNIGDVPHILILFYGVLKPISLKVLWKDSNEDIILDQYFEIPSPQTLQYDWWDQYGIYFIGPEDLEEGEYKVEISSKEFTFGNKIKNLTTSLDFEIIDSEDENEDED